MNEENNQEAVSREETPETAQNTEARKGRVMIGLHHPEEDKTIQVEAPRKMKLNFFQTMGALRHGLPPAESVKPIDWKGVAGMLAPFIVLIFIDWNAFAEVGFTVGLGILIDNYLLTRGYFKKYLQRRLAEGWQLTDPSQEKLLQETGVLPAPAAGRLKMKSRIRFAVYLFLLVVLFVLFA